MFEAEIVHDDPTVASAVKVLVEVVADDEEIFVTTNKVPNKVVSALVENALIFLFLFIIILISNGYC
jgi:hypothetical protein